MAITTWSHTERLSAQARAELRASHAGETGAVWIYRGILAVNFFKCDPRIDQLAREHLATETQHLAGFERHIATFRGSYLILPWMLAGFLTGALPTLFGRDAMYFTIYSVESFVHRHYTQQIDLLSVSSDARNTPIINFFAQCNSEEKAHRDQALVAMNRRPGVVLRLWGLMVGWGSQCAVKVARVV